MPIARRFRISGRVQGVWFRDSTRREAIELGLTGYAINLPDGDVEVLACGAASAIDRLRDWLDEGPPMASVTAVRESDAKFEELTGFRVG